MHLNLRELKLLTSVNKTNRLIKTVGRDPDWVLLIGCYCSFVVEFIVLLGMCYYEFLVMNVVYSVTPLSETVHPGLAASTAFSCEERFIPHRSITR